MNLDTGYLDGLRAFYRSQLLENVIPFWLKHGRDMQCGGYVSGLGRDGAPFEWTKVCMWNSGRTIWAFSHFYNEIEQRPEWLEMAKHGLDFARAHGFDPDGRMYYSLTRDGRPLEAPELFVEVFHVSGFSECARATQDADLAEQAWRMCLSVWDRLWSPGRAGQELLADTAPVRVFGHPLIMLNVLDELRRYRDRPEIGPMIDKCLHAITALHTKREQRAAFERVLWDGGPAPGHWGRWVNPGHMIEAGIFMVHEGQHRDDRAVIDQGVELIEWGYRLGWDEEFGGVFNDVDIEGKPMPCGNAYVASAKLWWQHAEALYGLLLAYVLTGRAEFLESHRNVHEYSFGHFADGDAAEWFAYLDRRGKCIHEAKGVARKSIFHVGRNLFYAWRLLEQNTRDGG